MHSIFHIGEDERFHFDWNWLTSSGLSVKDFIAPSSFYFKNGRTFKIGNTYGAMSFLAITASDISDQLLSDIPFWLASAREAKKECRKCMWLVHVVKIKGCLTQTRQQSRASSR